MAGYTVDRVRAFGRNPVRVTTAHGTFEGMFAADTIGNQAVTVLLFERLGDPPNASVVMILDDIEAIVEIAEIEAR